MEGDVRQKVAKQLVKGYLVHMLVYIVAESPIGGATARSGIRGTNFTLLFIGFISMWSLSFLE